MKYLKYPRGSKERWEYDSWSRTIRAFFIDGAVDIPVCTQRHPRHEAFFLQRTGEAEWQISPARCLMTAKGFEVRSASYDEFGVHSDFLHLSGAPPGVNDSMEIREDIAPVLDDTPTARWCPRCDGEGFTKEGECTLCDGNRFISFEDAAAWERLTQ